MSLFNFFRRKAKVPKNTDETPSVEQQQFCDFALQPFEPILAEKGFALTNVKVKGFSTTITFRKATQYIKVSSSTYPTDYPFSYNIILGDGDSETFFEYDWNSITLWRLKQYRDP